jgi:hypothetical protein
MSIYRSGAGKTVAGSFMAVDITLIDVDTGIEAGKKGAWFLATHTPRDLDRLSKAPNPAGGPFYIKRSRFSIST